MLVVYTHVVNDIWVNEHCAYKYAHLQRSEESNVLCLMVYPELLHACVCHSVPAFAHAMSSMDIRSQKSESCQTFIIQTYCITKIKKMILNLFLPPPFVEQMKKRHGGLQPHLYETFVIRSFPAYHRPKIPMEHSQGKMGYLKVHQLGRVESRRFKTLTNTENFLMFSKATGNHTLRAPSLSKPLWQTSWVYGVSLILFSKPLPDV